MPQRCRIYSPIPPSKHGEYGQTTLAAWCHSEPCRRAALLTVQQAVTAAHTRPVVLHISRWTGPMPFD